MKIKILNVFYQDIMLIISTISITRIFNLLGFIKLFFLNSSFSITKIIPSHAKINLSYSIATFLVLDYSLIQLNATLFFAAELLAIPFILNIFFNNPFNNISNTPFNYYIVNMYNLNIHQSLFTPLKHMPLVGGLSAISVLILLKLQVKDSVEFQA